MNQQDQRVFQGWMNARPRPAIAAASAGRVTDTGIRSDP
jgi:hypothetical protein